MDQKDDHKLQSPDEGFSANERVINDLIQKRKIQQDALKKIMTSIDKQEAKPAEAEPSKKFKK